MNPVPAPAASLTSVAGSSHNPPPESRPTPQAASPGSQEAPRVGHARRSSEGATPTNVTPLRSPNRSERITPIQGQTTPSTPFSAHVGGVVLSGPGMTGLSPDYDSNARSCGRKDVFSDASPYLQRGQSARSPEFVGGSLRRSGPAASPQLPDFLPPTGNVPRPTQERKPRAQRSQDAGRPASEPMPGQRAQRKSLPQPAGRLDPLWDQLTATIGALPGIGPQTGEKLNQALKNGTDRHSLRTSFDSVLRQIRVPARTGGASNPRAAQTSAEVPRPPELQGTARARFRSAELLPWPVSPPVEVKSPGEPPLSPDQLNFARYRYKILKDGPFARPSEAFNADHGTPGPGSGREDSNHEAGGDGPGCHADFAVSPNIDSKLSPMPEFLSSSLGKAGQAAPGFAGEKS